MEPQLDNQSAPIPNNDSGTTAAEEPTITLITPEGPIGPFQIFPTGIYDTDELREEPPPES